MRAVFFPCSSPDVALFIVGVYSMLFYPCPYKKNSTIPKISRRHCFVHLAFTQHATYSTVTDLARLRG